MKDLNDVFDEKVSNEISTEDDSNTPTTYQGGYNAPRGMVVPIINSSFTLEELLNVYLFGIDLRDQNGNPFPDQLLASYLNSSIQQVEALLDICLSEVEITGERHDYQRSDYQNWGYMQLWKRPVNTISLMRITYGERSALNIPLDWIQIDHQAGKIQLFPSSGSASSLIMTNTGIVYGMYDHWNYAPQMWEVNYNAGMKDGEVPDMIKELIYKKAAIGILQVWGDLIIGVGIASSSLSIDGLSQSIGTSRSGTTSPASARINGYQQDIDYLTNILRMQYQGTKMVVI